jgi:hypothetical protein
VPRRQAASWRARRKRRVAQAAGRAGEVSRQRRDERRLDDNGRRAMRTVFSVIIFAFVAYGIDAYLFHGKYTTAFVQVTSQIVQHIR